MAYIYFFCTIAILGICLYLTNEHIQHNHEEQTLLIEKNHLEVMKVLNSKLRIDKEFLEEVKHKIIVKGTRL